MDKAERFAMLDNKIHDAIDDLLEDTPTDITVEDVDNFLLHTDLALRIKRIIRVEKRYLQALTPSEI